jgi:hypothetical protein
MDHGITRCLGGFCAHCCAQLYETTGSSNPFAKISNWRRPADD